jgi:hydrogenase maturation protein HypF
MTKPDPAQTKTVIRQRLTVGGAVQGVGFRPFVYRLARELGLVGQVLNSPQGVVIEIEGPAALCSIFVQRLSAEAPPLAVVDSVDAVTVAPVGDADFVIVPSAPGGKRTALVLPDTATCADCAAEVFDSADRRYRYPFTNCTNCGPRFSIIRDLPYDRPLTSMAEFKMCPACQAEYENPLDRRFHAQPNACPECGPQLAWWRADGVRLAEREAALKSAVAALRAGQVVAVKGLGGFHLMVDAVNAVAVAKLRQRKQRPDKPLALMYPDMAAVEADCVVSEAEANLLTSHQAPIVLLARRPAAAERLAAGIAPDQPELGVMLPYTPLHALLLRDFGGPVVATSGNRADEPICINEDEALDRLAGIADAFLVHDRPIVRHVDDSIARIVDGQPQLLRRARGSAPFPIRLPRPVAQPTVAYGAHLKNTVALAVGDRAFISQHLGDLETVAANEAAAAVTADLQRLYQAPATRVAHDAHPDYRSTRLAQASGLPATATQHHHAHVLAVIAEQLLDQPVLGVAWDGTGWGPDSTIWGGEFLAVDRQGYERLGYLRPFRLPGGEAAIKQPGRTALGVLYELHGPQAVTVAQQLPHLKEMMGADSIKAAATLLDRQLNAPVTTSAGRLFDAVAVLLGGPARVSYEGQAAIWLENRARQAAPTRDHYDLPLMDGQLDWRPTVEAILEALRSGAPADKIAAMFHNSLVVGLVAMAQAVGREPVVLTGGCFQNRYLLERAIRELRAAGFTPYWPQQVPPNDGSIALGQIMATFNEK